jgi:hypothetical protein
MVVKPPVGLIEVYYAEGMRSILVPAGGDMLMAALVACGIWEEEGERVQVRVIRFEADGSKVCVSNFPASVEGP